MPELELLKLRPLLWEHQLICIKAKVAILTSYKKLFVGYFKLKVHIYALGTSETYFTSCKKGHNGSPLKHSDSRDVPFFPYMNKNK